MKLVLRVSKILLVLFFAIIISKKGMIFCFIVKTKPSPIIELRGGLEFSA
jgi:hypothetical protein